MRRSRGTAFRSIPVLAAGIVALLFPAPAAAKPLELATAIMIALRNNPAVASTEAGTRGARAAVGTARVPLLPRLQFNRALSRSFVHATSPTPQLGGVVAGIPIVQYTSLEVSNFALTQLITDFGRTRRTVRAAKHAVHASKFGEYASRAQLIAEVCLAYTEVALSARLLEIAHTAARVRAEFLAKVDEGFREGIRPRYDVARARLDNQTAQLGVLAAEAELARSRFKLEAVLGVEGAAAGPVIDNLDSTVTAAAPEPLVRNALKRRPEVLAAGAAVLRSEALLSAAKRGYFPRVASAGNYAHNDGTFGPGDSWALGLVAEVPLFDGLQTRHDIRRARAALDQAKAAVRVEEIAVVQEVRNAIVELEEARARAGEALALHARAQENVGLARERYTEGVGNIIEVTDAQLNVTAASQALARARADQQSAAFRLDRAAHLYPPEYFPVHSPEEPAPPGHVSASGAARKAPTASSLRELGVALLRAPAK